MAKRKTKRQLAQERRMYLVIILTIIFTIAVLVMVNALIGAIIDRDTIVIDYNYETPDDLLDLPLSIIDPEYLDGDMFKTYETDEYTSSLGIDVSSHQTAIDWDQVVEAGIEFVYIRVGYRGYQTGELNIDQMFNEHYEGAKAAGLEVGVYFFSQATSVEEAIEEAYFVYSIIRYLDIDLEVVYDLEDVTDADSRIEDVSAEVRTACAIAFASKIEELGYAPMIYTNLYWAENYYDLLQIMNYPLWYAQYNDTPDLPYYFRIWQYTETGVIPGITELVDIDIRIEDK